jgi:protein TonB
MKMKPKPARGWPSLLAASLALHGGILLVGAITLRARPAGETAAVPVGGGAPIDVSLRGENAEPRMGRATARPTSATSAAAAVNARADNGPSASIAPAAMGQMQSYASLIRARVDRALRYPVSLQRRGITGRVELRLSLGASGALERQETLRGSGNAELDGLATRAVSAAAPFPPPPAGPVPVVLDLPVEFKLAR